MTNSNSVKITQPPVPPYDYLSPEYSTCEYGNHRDGTYIKVYIPQNPYADDRGKYRTIIYLHGFSLGIPQFYQDHLEYLVKQGYFVFFPDYQKDLYDQDNVYQQDVNNLVQAIDKTFWSSSIVEGYKRNGRETLA